MKVRALGPTSIVGFAAYMLATVCVLQEVQVSILFANAISSFKRGFVRPHDDAFVAFDRFIYYVVYEEENDSPFSLQGGTPPVYSFSDKKTFSMRLTQAEYEALQEDSSVARIETDWIRFPTTISRATREFMSTDDEAREVTTSLKEPRQLLAPPPRNDPMDQIQALAAHEFTTGEGVKVCIIDSGVADHIDLDMSRFDGFEGDMERPWNEDAIGHGTFMSGIINAVNDNDIGVIGVAPSADVFVVRVFTDSGNQFVHSAGIVDAAEKCAEAGARVINMSLAGELYLESELEGLNNLVEKYGVLLVASAGNGGPISNPFYPASYPSVVSVGAVNLMEEYAPFSQANDFVDIVAPGVEIMSTHLDNSYTIQSGTSNSCAFVSGVAALLWSYKPEATVEEIRDAIFSSAKDLVGSQSNFVGRDPFFGHGLIQTMDALTLLNGGVPLDSSVPAPPAQDPPTQFPTVTQDRLNEIIPCIAVIDESEGSQTLSTIQSTWNQFRTSYPERPFCLLQPEPIFSSELFIPQNFLNDSNTIFSAVSRDNGVDAERSDWFNICNLAGLRAEGVVGVAIFIDNSGSLATPQVAASYSFLADRLDEEGLNLVDGIENSDEDWIGPFLTDFN